MKKIENGITLVALIITIIILLILAGITISALTNTGLFTRAKESKTKTRQTTAEEIINLKINQYQIKYLGTLTLNTLYEELNKNDEKEINIKEKKETCLIVTVTEYEEFEFTIGENLTIIKVNGIKKDNQNTEESEKNKLKAYIAINNDNILTKGTEITIKANGENEKISKIKLIINDNICAYTDELEIPSNNYEKNININSIIDSIKNINFDSNTKLYTVATDTNGKEYSSSSIYAINYTIGSIDGLNELSKKVNNGNTYEGKTIYQINNITTENYFEPIGYWNRETSWEGPYFAGKYEGNNHEITITSISTDDKYKSLGLFGMIINGEVKDLTVKGTIYNTSLDYVGGIAGAIKNGNIENCKNYTNITAKALAGGITAYIEKTNIKDCYNNGKILTNDIKKLEFNNQTSNWQGVSGGIVGQADNKSIINNCWNNGEISGSLETNSTGIIIGGIAGWLNNSQISKSRNTGNISGTIKSGIYRDGGMGGITGGMVNNSSVEECFNSGSVISTSSGHIGGISGYMTGSSLKNCYNIGKVQGGYKVGGIVGCTTYSANYIYNTYNATENVTGVEYVGNWGGYINKTTGSYNSSIKGKTILASDSGNSFTNYVSYTLSEMKTSNSLLTLLSNGNGSGKWKQAQGINDNMPYLETNKP